MGKAICFMNKKGGAGKSTTCIMSSIHFYIDLNHQVNNNFCAVVDLDSNYTIANLRQAEIDVLEERESSRFKSISMMNNLYSGDRDIMDVFSSSLDEIVDISDAMKQKYEYVFLDCAGSAFAEGMSSKFFDVPDLVVIPVKKDDENIRSAIDYINTIIRPMSLKKGFDYTLVFTDVLHSQTDKVKDIITALRGEGYNVLDTIIKSNVAYTERFFFDTRGRLSTFVARPAVEITALNNELFNILNR